MVIDDNMAVSRARIFHGNPMIHGRQRKQWRSVKTPWCRCSPRQGVTLLLYFCRKKVANGRCIFAFLLYFCRGSRFCCIYFCCSQSKLAIRHPAVPTGWQMCNSPDFMSLGPCFTRWTSPNDNSHVFLDCDCQNLLGECQCVDHLVSVKQCCWWLMAA